MTAAFFKIGIGNETPCAGKQKMCPSASSNQKKHLEDDTPWTPIIWPVALEEFTLNSQVFHFLVSKQRLVWESQPCPTSSGHLGRVGGPGRPTHLTTCAHLFPSTALVSITSMWNVEHSMGFRLIALEKLGPGKNTRLAGHMQSEHLTTLRFLELGRDGMRTH